jgi:CDP-diglyceride synthetase
MAGEARAVGESRKLGKDLGARVAVLVALVVGVLAPCAYSPAACAWVFRLAALGAACEWVLAMSRSYISPRALTVQSAGLLVWLVPTLVRIDERLVGPTACPGHRATLEAVMVVLVTGDSAQLACGRALGRTRIFPSISPNKTAEGYVGGLAIATAYAALVHGWPWWQTLVICLAGCVGDLYFSAFKRHMGCKDFSSVLGPHGGIADRIDSLVFAWAVMGYTCWPH